MSKESKEDESLNDAYDKSARTYHTNFSNDMKSAYRQELNDAYAKHEAEEENFSNTEFVASSLRSLKTTCRLCDSIFFSDNKLYQHLRNNSFRCDLRINSEQSKTIFSRQVISNVTILLTDSDSDLEQIIKSSTVFVKETEYAFRDWKYATFKLSWESKKSNAYETCVDTDCIMSLEDRDFVKSVIKDFFAQIKKLSLTISVRDINNKIH